MFSAIKCRSEKKEGEGIFVYGKENLPLYKETKAAASLIECVFGRGEINDIIFYSILR